MLHERNLRIHLVLGTAMLFFSRYYDFSRAELCLLILTIALVLVTELVNTAVEKTVDLESPRYHELARIAKDVAAGAVLLSALVSVVIGLYLFWDPQILGVIIRDLIGKNFMGMLLFLAAAIGFIFLRPQSGGIHQRKNDSRR